MSGTHDTLIYMANQIARNFATMEGDAALATADHIASFWDPRMKAAVFADGAGLLPVAAEAVELLRQRETPAHETRATESGGSDAG